MLMQQYIKVLLGFIKDIILEKFQEILQKKKKKNCYTLIKEKKKKKKMKEKCTNGILI